MFNPTSATSSNLIYNQLFPYIDQTLQQLLNEGRIDHNQKNLLMQIIQNILPSECNKLAAMYPNGIPSTDIYNVVRTIINNAINIHDSQCYHQPYTQAYSVPPQTPTYQPQPVPQTQWGYTPQTPTYQPQPAPQTTSYPSSITHISKLQPTTATQQPEKKEIQQEQKCNIEKELIGVSNLETIQRNLLYEKILSLREFKDSYGVKYITSKIVYTGSAFNNDFELILAFLKGNKDFLVLRNLNWLHLVKYKKFMLADIPYDDFKRQYDQVRNAVIEASQNLNIDNILKVFESQTYNFVMFFTKLLISDINEKLRRFLVTRNRIGKHFVIESLSDIDELYDYDLKVKDHPIASNALYKPTITKIVFSAFAKYFDKDSVGVFDMANPEQLVKGIFCDDLIYIGNQTKQQFISSIIKDPNAINNDIKSKLKDFSIFVTTEYVILSNVIVPEFEQVQENAYYMFDKVPNSEKIPIEEKVVAYKNNLEFLLAETFDDILETCMLYIIRGQNIISQLAIGRTMDSTIFLFQD